MSRLRAFTCLFVLASVFALAQEPVQEPQSSAEITVAEVPPADCGGTSRAEPISGAVRGAAPLDHRVVIYSFDCQGVWWVQPSEAVPLTNIAADGRWEAFVRLGRRYAVLVVSRSYRPATKAIALPEVSRDVVAMTTVRGADPVGNVRTNAASQPGPTTTQSPPAATEKVIMEAGRLTAGYDMGVNSSRGRTDWVRTEPGELAISYPVGQDWGAVFVTAGPARDVGRSGQDFMGYRSLIVEMKGQRGGELVEIGLKDDADPDNGSESKSRVRLQAEWQRVEIPVSAFRTADLRRLYVVAEFVFAGPQPVAISVRRISFTR
jgi:hypothetical protein